MVLTPTPGGPADKAGVKAGDVIVSVDDTPTRGLSLYDVSDLLQGEADSQVGEGWAVAGVRSSCHAKHGTPLHYSTMGWRAVTHSAVSHKSRMVVALNSTMQWLLLSC